MGDAYTIRPAHEGDAAGIAGLIAAHAREPGAHLESAPQSEPMTGALLAEVMAGRSHSAFVAEGPEVVVHQPDNVLDAMGEWCTKVYNIQLATNIFQRYLDKILEFYDGCLILHAKIASFCMTILTILFSLICLF